MKLKRIEKNAVMLFAYGASFKMFKKQVRRSPDSNISRIPARKLKQIAVSTLIKLKLRANRFY